MAAGDINDPLSNVPNIVLVDQSAASAAPGAGYGRVEIVNGVLGLRLGTGAWIGLVSLTAGLLTPLTEKVTPADTDLVLLQDEADASALKKVQVSNLPGGGDGGGFGEPVDWSGTLTLTQGAALTLANVVATYQLCGPVCLLVARADIRSSGTNANVLVLGGIPDAAKLPVTYKTVAGSFMYWVTGASVHRVGACSSYTDDAQMIFYVDNAYGPFGAAPVLQAANGDSFMCMAIYPVPA